MRYLLLGVYAVLWVGGIWSYWVAGQPPVNSVWAAPLFLCVAGLLVLAFTPAIHWPGCLLLGAAGFAVEAVGVHAGFPFGAYHYQTTLFPLVAGVPLVMAAAWLVLGAYAWSLWGNGPSLWRSAFAAALWMTAMDLVIDPLAANALQYWRWAQPGWYYGIPGSNFLGWFGVSLGLFLVLGRRLPATRRMTWLGASVLLFFTLIAGSRQYWLPGFVGVCLLAAHGFIVRARRPSPGGS